MLQKVIATAILALSLHLSPHASKVTLPVQSGSGTLPDYASTFEEALAHDWDTVVVPSGVYPVSRMIHVQGPRVLMGSGSIVPTDGFTLPDVNSPNSCLIKLDGGPVSLIGIRVDARRQLARGIYSGGHPDAITIEDVSVKNALGHGIYFDNGIDIKVRNCTLADNGGGIVGNFSSRMEVIGNSVLNSLGGDRGWGIQVWGIGLDNQKYTQLSHDIVVKDNYVANSSSAGIMLAGVRNAVVTGNHVAGSEDVGIDAEFCRNISILNNIAKRARHGCIALFYGSQDVQIVGNTIINDHPSKLQKYEGAMADCGILLAMRKDKYESPECYRNILIEANTIYTPVHLADTDENGREAIRIFKADSYENIFVRDNQVMNSTLRWDGETFPDNSVVHFAEVTPLLFHNSAENNDARWGFNRTTAQASLSCDRSQPYTGTAALKLSNATAAAPGVYAQAYKDLIVEPSSAYQISAMAKGSAVGYAWIGGGGANWEQRIPLPTGDFPWTKLVGDFVTGPSQSQYSFMAVSEGKTGALWLDNVWVKKVRTLVTNGGFELDLSGWGWNNPGNRGGYEIVTSARNSGAKSIRIWQTGDYIPGQYAHINQTLTVVPNTAYEFSCWVKGQNAGSSWIGGGPGWTMRNGLPEGTYDWKRVTFTDTPGPGVTTYPFLIHLDAGSQIWVYNIVVIKKGI